MPDLASATVRLVLDDGSERIIPVFDVDHLARRLYLEDCERQMIESLVGIESSISTPSSSKVARSRRGHCGSPGERRPRR